MSSMHSFALLDKRRNANHKSQTPVEPTITQCMCENDFMNAQRNGPRWSFHKYRKKVRTLSLKHDALNLQLPIEKWWTFAIVITFICYNKTIQGFWGNSATLLAQTAFCFQLVRGQGHRINPINNSHTIQNSNFCFFACLTRTQHFYTYERDV